MFLKRWDSNGKKVEGEMTETTGGFREYSKVMRPLPMKHTWWAALQTFYCNNQWQNQCGEWASEMVAGCVQSERIWVHPLSFLHLREHEKVSKIVSWTWEDERCPERAHQTRTFIRTGQISCEFINLLLATKWGLYEVFFIKHDGPG